MNIIKKLACATILLSLYPASFAAGQFVQNHNDKAEAVSNAAGYYKAQTGEFVFAEPPTELVKPSAENTAKLLMEFIPQRKPKI